MSIDQVAFFVVVLAVPAYLVWAAGQRERVRRGIRREAVLRRLYAERMVKR